MQRYWRLTRGLTLGVRAVVMSADGGLLLVRHTYTKGWHLPGGGVEFHQTAAAALEQELLEEVGIRTAGAAPELFGIYSNAERFAGDHVILYLVHGWEQVRPLGPNREIAEACFFTIDALPRDTTPATLRRMDEVHGRARKSPLW